MKEQIFALDIGTRKVMGIVAQRGDDSLEIIDAEVIEHTSRPMFDGQIHSIDEVARTVRKIKERLESRLSKKLDKVGVAVAGRNLLTYKSRVKRDFSAHEEITPDIIRDLELEAIDKINTDSGKDLSEFYCVGYSPVYYELDGNRINNPVGHRARSIAAEVIVTFLPRLVLDSIFAVLKKANLEGTNITLEPISAINAIIPAEMRNLNIVLVDIGAGTSDLALAKDGMVFAYGMVPEAGDEITESISENLLADFSTAERIKRSIQSGDTIEYQDIWNRPRRIDSAAFRETTAPAVKKLAGSISRACLDLNGGLPQAIVLVGGGSMTFGLIEELALNIGLPPYKIGIRLPELIKGLKDKTGKLSGPEAVTPIGIALMTDKSQGLRFIHAEVNHKKIIMLDFQQKKDIMGALTLSGVVNEKRLYPHPGLALTVKVNGQLKVIRGTMGCPAKVLLNGKPINSLADKISDGDKITFEEALNGADASAIVSDVADINKVRCIFNNDIIEVAPSVFIEGEAAALDAPVVDRANITVSAVTAREVLRSRGVALESLSERQILINLNGSPKILTQRNFSLQLNKEACGVDTLVRPNDIVEFSSHTPTAYRIKDVVEFPKDFEKIRIKVDDKDIEVILDTIQVFMNGHQVQPEEFLIDGADIQVYQTKERKVLLSEIFRYIDVQPQKVYGKRIKLFVDDIPAGFTTPLVDGSRVKILFEDRG